MNARLFLICQILVMVAIACALTIAVLTISGVFERALP